MNAQWIQSYEAETVIFFYCLSYKKSYTFILFAFSFSPDFKNGAFLYFAYKQCIFDCVSTLISSGYTAYIC